MERERAQTAPAEADGGRRGDEEARRAAKDTLSLRAKVARLFFGKSTARPNAYLSQPGERRSSRSGGPGGWILWIPQLNS